MNGPLSVLAAALVALSWALLAVVPFSLWSGRAKIGFKGTGIYSLLMAVLFFVLAFVPVGKSSGSPPAGVVAASATLALTFFICGIEMLVDARVKFRFFLCGASFIVFAVSFFLIGKDILTVLTPTYYGMGAPLLVAPPIVISFLLIQTSKESIGLG